MRAVNLLPQDAERTGRRRINRVALAGVAGGVAVSMLLGALYLSAHQTVTDRELELSAARAELAATPKPKTQGPGNEQLARERSGRVAAVAQALSGRIGWDRILRELSSVLPADVWLVELNAQGAAASSSEPAAATASSGGPLTLRGYTYTQEGVARFLARLAVVRDLSAVELESSKRVLLGGQKVYEFTITAQVRATGASS